MCPLLGVLGDFEVAVGVSIRHAWCECNWVLSNWCDYVVRRASALDPGMANVSSDRIVGFDDHVFNVWL